MGKIIWNKADWFIVAVLSQSILLFLSSPAGLDFMNKLSTEPIPVKIQQTAIAISFIGSLVVARMNTGTTPPKDSPPVETTSTPSLEKTS